MNRESIRDLKTVRRCSPDHIALHSRYSATMAVATASVRITLDDDQAMFLPIGLSMDEVLEAARKKFRVGNVWPVNDSHLRRVESIEEDELIGHLHDRASSSWSDLMVLIERQNDGYFKLWQVFARRCNPRNFIECQRLNVYHQTFGFALKSTPATRTIHVQGLDGKRAQLLVQEPTTVGQIHKEIRKAMASRECRGDVFQALWFLQAFQTTDHSTKECRLKITCGDHVVSVDPNEDVCLASLGVHGSDLAIKIIPLIAVDIKTLKGKTIRFSIDPMISADNFRELIQDKEGIPPEQQRLIFNGKQLEDHRPLAMYGVSNGSIISLVLRLRGGMFQASSSRKDMQKLTEQDQHKLDIKIVFPNGELTTIRMSPDHHVADLKAWAVNRISNRRPAKEEHLSDVKERIKRLRAQLAEAEMEAKELSCFETRE